MNRSYRRALWLLLLGVGCDGVDGNGLPQPPAAVSLPDGAPPDGAADRILRTDVDLSNVAEIRAYACDVRITDVAVYQGVKVSLAARTGGPGGRGADLVQGRPALVR